MISFSYLNLLLYLAVSMAPVPVNMVSIEVKGKTVYLEQFSQKELKGIWHTSIKDIPYILVKETSVISLMDPPPEVTRIPDIINDPDAVDWQNANELKVAEKYRGILGQSLQIAQDNNMIRVTTVGLKYPDTFIINLKVK